MVDYPKWTSLVFEAAPASADATDVISFAADEWNATPELKDATVAEAREHARSIV